MDRITNTPINFGAKLIKNVDIKKINPKSHLCSDAKASFVKFEPNNSSDLAAVVSAAREWKGQQYAGYIANNALNISNNVINKDKNHIYLLTLQQSNLEKLKPGKILGMVHLNEESGKNELVYFQVKPTLKHGASKREIKHIGTSIINALKQTCKKPIELFSSYEAANFYERQGFKLINENNLTYRWDG